MLPGTSEATHSVCSSWKNSSVQVGRGREQSGELVWGRVGKGLVQQVKDFRGQTAGGDRNIWSRRLVSSELYFRKVSQAMAVRMDLRNTALKVSCLPQTLLSGESGSQGVRI